MKNLCKISLFPLLIATMFLCFGGCNVELVPDQNDDPGRNVDESVRKFELTYGAKIMGAPKDAKVKVWFPIAQTNGQQAIEQTKKETPGELQVNDDAKYGNKIGFFETTSDGTKDIQFAINYDVERNEAIVDEAAKELSKEQKDLFLSANSLVPTDGKPQEMFKSTELPSESMEKGKSLYNLVEQHMKYDKTNPGYGKGDAEWACDSKTGNCTDFHSLFISLARSNSIPARFEIGFPLPADKKEGKIGGYHCWAWFHAEGKGWAPVDISEADKHPEMKDYYFGKLTADRVAFSTGRDIELVPKSEAGPQNYFVYPHVEVDGEVWPKEKIELNFSFKNK